MDGHRSEDDENEHWRTKVFKMTEEAEHFCSGLGSLEDSRLEWRRRQEFYKETLNVDVLIC